MSYASKPRVHEFFEQIAVTVSEEMVAEGIDAKVAERVSWKVADHIKANFGGELLYIPKGTWQEVYAVHEEIYNRYNSKMEHPRDLARLYKRSEPAIYLIIRRVRARRKAAQPTLFDTLAVDREIPEAGAG